MIQVCYNVIRYHAHTDTGYEADNSGFKSHWQYHVIFILVPLIHYRLHTHIKDH